MIFLCYPANIAGRVAESMGYAWWAISSPVVPTPARNRMAKVKRGGSVIAAYQHNGKGERVIKTAGGNTTHFVYDLMGNIIVEANGAG
ncbi:hypothetical protein, partial [Gilvimarinus agarilyticus]|uniref:hypothetical protein n=1 Tax=Gilvimarinus agarilyticus TaxID=679259 RepID=UPI0018DBC431